MAKLNIYACDDSGFSPKGDPFVVAINPEQIQITRGVSYNNEDNGTNTAGNSPKFNGYEDDQVSFDLYFDGTGLVSNYEGQGNKPKAEKIDVAAKIDELHDLIYDYQGENHRPNYTKLSWGSFQFNCTLKSISTTYTLFKRDGTPLRAKVSLSFLGFINPGKKESQAFKQSPDMTHVKTVRIGDTLPQMCKDIYGEIDYFQQVARVNGLVNFRDLEVGSKLYFPPLEK